MTKKRLVKKSAAKTRATKAAPVRRTPAVRTAAVESNRTAAATIFVYSIGGATRVRTSPHYLVAGPGYIEWTVVNLTSDAKVPVEITFPGGGPFGAGPIRFDDYARIPLAGAKDGHYKYSVTANGYTEDPEVEIPEMG